MIIECSWHEKYFGHKKIVGEKEPLNDKRVTSGFCPVCFRIHINELESMGYYPEYKFLPYKFNDADYNLIHK